MEINGLANRLDEAELEHREIVRLTVEHPALSIADAYRIQDALLKNRLGRGEKIIGYKMGLTSKAKMKQMSVDAPIYGVLTDVMLLESGSKFSLKNSIHAKIEPEVAFLIGDDIRGTPKASELSAKCAAVCAAMEIIDSRYENFNFTLPDVIADNCSSSYFVLGPWKKDFASLDLGNLGMILEADEKPLQFGSTAAILGHPLESLAALLALLHGRGLFLPKGSIVMAGSSTAAVSLDRGKRYRALVQDLSPVGLEVHHE